jgi:hypothetical protein
MSRVTQSKIDKAVKAVAAVCGAAQVVFETDGRVRVLPAAPEGKAPAVDWQGEIRL